TRDFLDYFGLKTLDQLPSLAEIKSLEELDPQLALPEPVGAVALPAPESVGESADDDAEPETASDEPEGAVEETAATGLAPEPDGNPAADGLEEPVDGRATGESAPEGDLTEEGEQEPSRQSAAG